MQTATRVIVSGPDETLRGEGYLPCGVEIMFVCRWIRDVPLAIGLTVVCTEPIGGLRTAVADVARKEILYVENTRSGDVTLIQVPERADGTHKVVGTIRVGVYPDDIVASNRGDVVYVSRTQSAGIRRFPRVGESGEILAIGTSTNKILWRVPVDGMAHHCSVSPDDRYIFVPLFNMFFLVVIDTHKRAVVARVPVGYGPHGTRLSPDKKRLYVGTMMTDQIAVVDAERFELLRAIPFDDAVRPFDITRDEKRLYAQISRYHGVLVVDLRTDRVIERIPLPKLPDGTEYPRFFPHTVNHGLALSPDEKLLFAAGSIADYVAVYTVGDHKLVKTIAVGDEPNWIIFNQDGRYAYVTNRGSDELSVISMADLVEIERISVGDYPQRMTTVVLDDAGS